MTPNVAGALAYVLGFITGIIFLVIERPGHHPVGHVVAGCVRHPERRCSALAESALGDQSDAAPCLGCSKSGPASGPSGTHHEHICLMNRAHMTYREGIAMKSETLIEPELLDDFSNSI